MTLPQVTAKIDTPEAARVHPVGVNLTGAYLICVHLIGVYLRVYLTGVHLMGVLPLAYTLRVCISRVYTSWAYIIV